VVREGRAQTPPPPKEPYPTDEARGAEVVLNTPLRKWIFFGGIVGAILLVLALSLIRLGSS
jgi:uncharacterized membrane protein YdcZ (DUF606 family)